MSTPLITTGFHHITMVSRDARRTLAYYRELLGVGLVKKTVNFDDPTAYHLYFGDARGAPGTQARSAVRALKFAVAVVAVVVG